MYYGVITLAVLPASVQYPFVTGGTMIVSCVTAVLRRQKPSWREWLSLSLAPAGVLILVLIPI